jgi:hypothetical protein
MRVGAARSCAIEPPGSQCHDVGLMTTAQAAAALHVSPEYVSRLATRGRIVGVKVAHRWLLEGASVRSYAPQKPRPKPPLATVPAGPLRSSWTAAGAPRLAAYPRGQPRRRRSSVHGARAS